MAESYITPGLGDFLEVHVKELTDTKMAWAKEREFKLIESLEELSDFIDKAIEAKKCVVDIEATGLNTRTDRDGNPTDRIVGFCLSYDVMCGVYVPIRHREGEELNLPEKAVFEEIARLCANCVTIYHNAKYDLQMLRNHGVVVNDHHMFEDTLLLARLYDAGQKAIGLKVLSDRLLNQPMLELADISNATNRIDFVSPRVAIPYTCADAVCTLGLYEFFMAQDIIKEQESVYALEKRTTLVVLQMERNLVKIDVEYLEKLKTKTEEDIRLIKKEVFDLVGFEFNLGSPQQLGEILFDKLGYKYPERRKTASGQYITDTATLTKIADDYPIVNKIIKYRGLDKVLGTYITNLLRNRDENGCIKLSFNQSGTDTGRFSSPGGEGIDKDGYCGMNTQSIPSNYEEGMPDIRRAFIARPGCKIVAADYSGEELRIATNLSREPKWMEAFLHGDGDLHSATGRIIYGRQEITKAERQCAKTTNFLTMYGGGHKGLSVQAKISENEARKILTQFFAGLQKLKRWIDVEHVKARKLKKVRTAFGRARPLEIFYKDGDKDDPQVRQLRARGDRCAVNTLIQGAGADIMKLALVRVYNWIRSEGLEDEVKMLITMHDEIVFEMPENKLMTYIPIINQKMKMTDILQGKLKWPIPLKVDAEYGDSWHVTNDFFKEHPELEDVSEPAAISPRKVEVPEPETTKPEESPQEESSDDVHQDSPSEKTESVSDKVEDPPKKTEPEPEGTSSEESVTSESDKQPESTESEPVKEMAADGTPTPESSGQLIYTLRDTRESTLRDMNEILRHLMKEEKLGKYKGPKKILVLRNRDGYSLLVSDMKVSIDAFLALARFKGI